MNATTEIVMQNKIYFPTVCCGVGKGQGCKTLEIEVTLATQMCRDWDTMEEKRMYTFTACGSGMGYGGQCLDTFKDKAFRYIMPDEKKMLFDRIFKIWNEYHLNDLQAGTKWQTELYQTFFEEVKRMYPDKAEKFDRISRYDMICLSEMANINLRENNYQPLMIDTKRDNYKYGSSWLCKPIPQEIVEEIITWGNIRQEPREAIDQMRKQLYREYRKATK